LISHRHALTVEEVRGRLERAAQAAKQRHNVSWRWEAHTLEVLPPAGIAEGARGRIEVRDHAVQVEVHIPLRFVPVRGNIANRLVHELEALLGSEEAA
jgi:hypothetical protein